MLTKGPNGLQTNGPTVTLPVSQLVTPHPLRVDPSIRPLGEELSDSLSLSQVVD
ncbi:hypothetical protein JMJ76_0011765 [Colletotrichum scovillei]|nr:hypothetical protein JMJ76_0011765 [Colletotrichum scovillei]KAG7082526.1 hypothetical protein JMJ78_0004627 [Colletotrichum scovillei]